MIVLLIIAVSLQLSSQAKLNYDGETNETRHVVEALNAVLEDEPQHGDFVIVLKGGSTMFVNMAEVRAPWGISVFEVKVDDQDSNVTQTHLSLVGEQARKLREISQSVSVLVMSDDVAFLTTFGDWSLYGGLVVWSTRLLVLTRLPLHRLHHLRNTFAKTFSVLLHVPHSSSFRVKVYVDLPYSQSGSEMLPVASWTPKSGLQKASHISNYPDKFSKFSNGARLSVSRVVNSAFKTMIVDDPGAPGEKKTIVLNARDVLLEVIADNMNFTIKYVSPADRHWGTLRPDGSWSGMVGMVIRQEADIGLGLFTMTPSRYKAVDFTYPVDISYTCLFGGRGLPEVDPWSFLLPLTPLVWVILLTVLLGVVAVATLLMSCSPLQTNLWPVLQNTSATYIRIVLQQDALKTAGWWWWWERVVMGIWMLMTLVMTRSYAGNLISQLAVRYVPEPLHTLEDFLDTRATLIIYKGTSDEQAFRTATGGVFREVWELNKVGRIRLLHYSDQDLILDALREGDAYTSTTLASHAMRTMSLQFSVTGKCEFYIGRGHFLPSMDSVAVAKGAFLHPSLSRKVMQVKEGGLFWYWMRLYFRNMTTCLNAPRKFVIKSPLAIRNIWGMFVVLAGGGVASLLVFFMELLYSSFITMSTK